MPVLVFFLNMKLLVQAEYIPDLGFPVTKADGVQKPCQWEEWMEVLINYPSFFKVDIVIMVFAIILQGWRLSLRSYVH